LKSNEPSNVTLLLSPPLPAVVVPRNFAPPALASSSPDFVMRARSPSESTAPAAPAETKATKAVATTKAAKMREGRCRELIGPRTLTARRRLNWSAATRAPDVD
jgi:hypothetical protein